MLLEKANDLFGDARLDIEAAKAVSAIEWPLPPMNADGTQLEENGNLNNISLLVVPRNEMIPIMTVS